jgi:hypothetical protein
MKKIGLLLSIICTVAVSVSAQEIVRAACPTLNVYGPAGIVRAGERIPFSLLISNAAGLDLTFKWRVYNGDILEGQGTQETTVAWPDMCRSLIVEVEATGVPMGCPYRASETVSISHCKPMIPSLIAEISERSIKASDPRVGRIKQAIKANSSSQIYVIIYHSELRSKSNEHRDQMEIFKLLALPLDERSRLTFVHSRGLVRVTKYWLVPPGADNPMP